MRGWLLFWGALFAAATASSWVGENVGETAQEWFAGTSFAAILIGVFVARGAHRARVQRTADVLIDRYRNEEPGAFGRRYDTTSGPDADRMRIADASREVLRAYGGRHVVNLLINEGYQDVIIDDLADVFGDRAQSIYPAVIGMANRPGFMTSGLLPFGLGVFAGYKATARR